MAYDFYVRSKQDLIGAVEEYGIVPYFATSIPGFSLEEHCSPSVLFSDFEDDTWAWKGPVIRATGCAYGKFFEKKSTYVNREVFLDLANYRRDGYDFDARYDDGLAKFQDKQLYDLIDAHAPVLSKELRVTGGYAYSGRWQKTDGKKGFDTTITRLQEQCYVIISDFVYTLDKHGCPVQHAGEVHGKRVHGCGLSAQPRGILQPPAGSPGRALPPRDGKTAEEVPEITCAAA